MHQHQARVRGNVRSLETKLTKQKMTPIKITNETVYAYNDKINIKFQDGVFYSASGLFGIFSNRDEWRRFAAIEAEITRIEESLKENRPIHSLDSNGTSNLETRTTVIAIEVNPCFSGTLISASITFNPFDPAWRELLDDEILVYGDPIYRLVYKDWSTIMDCAGSSYSRIKAHAEAFTTRPLPEKKELQ